MKAAGIDWPRHQAFLMPAVLLWAWQADVLLLGITLSVLFELPRVVAGRLEISQADFDRLWSFTSVLFLAVLFYLALSQQGLNAVGILTGAPTVDGEPDGLHRVSSTALTFLRCIPGILAPFTIAVHWSRTQVLPWSTFSLYEQARARRQPGVPPPEWARQWMHPGYLYLGITLFIAGMSTNHAPVFLPILLAVTLATLWPLHNRGHRPFVWFLVLGSLFAVAVAARHGHDATQAAWEALEERLLSSGAGADTTLSWNGPSPQNSRNLAFGTVGTLQQSGTILLRVTTSDGNAPGLLRDACFNRFHGTTWDSHPLAESEEQLHQGQGPATGQSLTITRASADGEAPLAIPQDAAQFTVPPGAQVMTVGLDSYRMRGTLPLATATVTRGAHRLPATPPDPADLRLDLLSDSEQQCLTELVGQLGLINASPESAADRLEQWFGTQFTYSLYHAPVVGTMRPLVRFLTVERAGHCEYFATATVLLLRAAGIPARYAVGFSVTEMTDGLWLARGRDAHAWAIYWDGSRWLELDTTPGTWRETVGSTTSWFEPWGDRWSDLWYRFALWRQEGGRWQVIVFVVGMLILGYIAWRQLRGSAWQRVRELSGRYAAWQVFGLDSPAIPLWTTVARIHGPRQPGETLHGWLERLDLLKRVDGLEDVVNLHERLRFDPAGLPDADRQRLASLVGSVRSQLTAARRG